MARKKYPSKRAMAEEIATVRAENWSIDELVDIAREAEIEAIMRQPLREVKADYDWQGGEERLCE